MQLTEEQLLESFSQYLDENYHVEQLSEGNVVWVFENEYMPALFEAYVEENYFVDQLTEENLQWIYEEEFLGLIGQKEEISEEQEEVEEVKEVSPTSIYADFISLQEKKSGSMRNKNNKDKDKDNNMDPVGKENPDINNDGKVTPEDGYLHNRRKAIAKAMGKKRKK